MESSKSLKTLLACALVVLLTGLVFGPTVGFDYVNLDDPMYVSKNAEVQKGITLHGLGEAFRERDLLLYTPLTHLSHMLDCQLFGIAPAGHHLMNVALHTAAALLLLLALYRATGHLWTSTACALLFAIHPLRSESVAWIAERKDVLSLALGMAGVLAYVRYTRAERRKAAWYGLSLGWLALSLLAKPMLVTFPALLLILDFWPLQRLADVRARLAEKLPFAAVSLAGLALVLGVPVRPGEATAFGFVPPLAWRLGNACISPMVYLGQTICPVNLGALYLFAHECPPVWQIVSCLLGLIAITAAAFQLRKPMPWLLAGWLWFLVSLPPVLHLLPMGTDRHADRYTYVPGIGLAIAFCWSLRAWAQRSAAGVAGREQARVPALFAVLTILLGSATCAQNYLWENSETLWRTTNEHCGVTELAEINLAAYLQETGRAQEGIAEALKAVQMGPYVPLAHLNLANCLMSLHRPAEAIREYAATLALDPRNSEGHSNLGAAYLSIGKAKEGIAEIEIGLRLDPAQEHARRNLERALAGHKPSRG